MIRKTALYCTIAVMAVSSTASADDMLRQGAIACRTETAVLAYEEFERRGDKVQKHTLRGGACLFFDKDLEVIRRSGSRAHALVEIEITNGRRSITLWTRPESLRETTQVSKASDAKRR